MYAECKKFMISHTVMCYRTWDSIPNKVRSLACEL